jgi:transcriptional regulator with XRE-family HTH domain
MSRLVSKIKMSQGVSGTMYEFLQQSPVMPRGFSNPASAEKISKRLIQLRKALGHTQESLAEALDVGRSQLANYESGEPERIITLPVALTLCAVTGISLDWIYRGSEQSVAPELADRLRAQARIEGDKARVRTRRRRSSH